MMPHLTASARRLMLTAEAVHMAILHTFSEVPYNSNWKSRLIRQVQMKFLAPCGIVFFGLFITVYPAFSQMWTQTMSPYSGWVSVASAVDEEGITWEKLAPETHP